MCITITSLVLLVLLPLCSAQQNVKTYNFTVGWVTANPDGAFNKPTMGINGRWPLPPIEVTSGDRLIVNLYNDLKNESTSLHFHGLYQNGTTHMDGPVGVSQCAVPPGSSFTYNFTVDQPGTYWYHSHARGQYPDGLRGPFLVTDPQSPYKDVVDDEIVMTLSDHYHDLMPGLLTRFISVENPTGAEPVPNAALMNDMQNVSFPVQSSKTYMFRIVNMAAFAGQYLWFEGHTMEIVEVDGIWTERQAADMIYVSAAQRYSVLVTMRNDTSENFAIVASMDQDLFDTIPDGLNPNVTGWLVYDAAKPLPEPMLLDELAPYDDFALVPVDGDPILENPTQSVVLTMKMDNLGDGANYAFFNNVSYVTPKVPALYTALTTGQNAMSPEVYGVNSNSFVLPFNEVVELVLNNNDAGKHPFHLHGHDFQVLVRADEEAGGYDPTNTTSLPSVPMRRDTLVVRPNSHFVIRWRNDNPGIWLFHCHIEWHVASGLVATIIEAPLTLQERLPYDSIPTSHLDVCKAQGVPIAGNAAGNTDDLYDLTGANASPAPLPAGFEAKGIVALVFSCVSALLGMIVIGWYGMKPLSAKVEVQMERQVEKIEAIAK